MPAHEEPSKEKPMHPIRTPAESKVAAPKPGASGPFSTTAVAEELKPPPPKPDDKARKDAEGKVAGLQKQYDETLAKLQVTAESNARAQLVLEKGNLTRQIDAAKRAGGIK